MDWARVTMKALAIGLGAAIGANLRYLIGWWFGKLFQHEFPWATFAVNLLGSFLIGIAVALSLKNSWDHNLSGFIIIGALGGFTTFSTFSNENLQLLQKGRIDLLLFNVIGSVVIGLLLAWVGFILAQKQTG